MIDEQEILVRRVVVAERLEAESPQDLDGKPAANVRDRSC